MVEWNLNLNHGSDPVPASKTINGRINAALEAENQAETPRDYLGASRLGEECSRRLQYEYQHTPRDHEFEGSILRIFQTGHMFEDLAIRWLRAGGYDLRIEKSNGDQYGFSVADGRIAGHIDGVLIGGPEGLIYPCLWECKSLNEKSWKDLVRRTARVATPVYYTQVQLYMAYMQLTDHPAVLTAVNKNTSGLWHEIIPFDPAEAQKHSDRGVQILRACDAGELLPRIASSSDFFKCKMCPYAKRCWNHGQS